MCQEKLGNENEDVIKAMGAFGGGIASSGSVCGILVGGIAAISSLYSRGNLEEKENPRMWSVGYKFLKRFEALAEPHGGMDCRDIARVDWRDREAVREFYQNPEGRREVCRDLVGEAASILGEILNQEAQRQKDQDESP